MWQSEGSKLPVVMLEDMALPRSLVPANNLQQNGSKRFTVTLYLSTIVKLDVNYHIDSIVIPVP